MKILEVITEDHDWTKTKGSLNANQLGALPGAHLVSGTADRVYDLYRLGLVVAASDGQSHVNGNGESWVGRNNVVSPFTQQEADMLRLAYRANGLKWTDKLHPNPKNKSIELSDTNVVSPTASTSWKKIH